MNPFAKALAAKNGIQNAFQGIGKKIRRAYEADKADMIKAQQNFKNRSDNSNYYGSTKSWK